MMQTAHHAGRLIEVRIVAPVLDEDAEGLDAQLTALYAAIGRPAVVCVDLRQAPEVPAEVVSRYVGVLNQDNPHAERAAFILSPAAAALYLAAGRFVHETDQTSRRVFRAVSAAIEWLGDALDAAERDRLAVFLGATRSQIPPPVA